MISTTSSSGISGRGRGGILTKCRAHGEDAGAGDADGESIFVGAH